jgi:hypothetical protein
MGTTNWIRPLLGAIGPHAVYRRVPLADERNALGPWRRAVEQLAKPQDERDVWGELIYGSGEEEEGAALGTAQIAPARALLQRNAETLQWLDEGVERGSLQFPVFHDLEQVAADSQFACKLGEVARLPYIHSKLLAADGDLAAAAAATLRVLRIGQMICRGDGQMLHYLIGLWIRSAALRGMGRLAARDDLPRPALQSFLQALQEGLHARDGLAQSLRVDFCTLSLPRLAQTVDDQDLEAVVQQVLAVYYAPRQPPVVPDPARAAALGGEWLDWQRRQILSILEGHPNPFDKLATARLMGGMLAQTLGEIRHVERTGGLHLVDKLHRLRRHYRRRWLRRKTRFWPAPLAPGFPYEWGSGSNLELAPGELAASISIARQLLTESTLATAREKLRRVANPIGLVLAEHLLAFDYSSFMFQHRAMANQIRRLLANRLA